MAKFKVDKSAVIEAFNQHTADFDDVIVIGKFRKALRKENGGTYYVASSTSAKKTDNTLFAAADEWLEI